MYLSNYIGSRAMWIIAAGRPIVLHTDLKGQVLPPLELSQPVFRSTASNVTLFVKDYWMLVADKYHHYQSR